MVLEAEKSKFNEPEYSLSGEHPLPGSSAAFSL
jgi:hypothetical protein